MNGGTLVVAFDLPPAPNAGAQRLYRLACEVRSAGPGPVHVLTPEGGATPPGTVGIPFASAIPHARQNPLARLGLEIRLGLTLVSQVRRGRYDRVVISTPLFVPTLCILAWCRLEGIPYLLDIRDPYPAVYVEAGLIRGGGVVERILQRAATSIYVGARLVTTATKGLAREVRQHAPGQVVRARRNGHGGRTPDQITRARREGAPFRVACHGNFGAFQDVGGLLELVGRVLEEADGIEFLFVGRGPGLDAVIRARRERGWGDRVTVHPPTSPRRLWELLQGTHLGLSIRRDDAISRRAFPVRITDYLELGAPVVVIPHSEAGRIVDRLGVGRTFASDDLLRAASFIGHLADSRDAYEAHASRARLWGPCFSRERTLRDSSRTCGTHSPNGLRRRSTPEMPRGVNAGRGSSSAETPTEAIDTEESWDAESRPGGLRSHRSKTLGSPGAGPDRWCRARGRV